MRRILSQLASRTCQTRDNARILNMEPVVSAAPTPPVILADDVLGELDDTRRRAFWQEVGESHQVIATGTVPPPSGDWLTYRVTRGSYLQA